MKRLLFLIYVAIITSGCDNTSNSENTTIVADAAPENIHYNPGPDLNLLQLLELRRMTTKEIDAYLTTRAWLYQGEQEDAKNYGNQVAWSYSRQKDKDGDIEAAYIIHTKNRKIISNDYIFNNANQFDLFSEELKEMGLSKGRTLSDEDGTMIEYIDGDILLQLNKNNRLEEPNFALMIRPLK